MADRFYCPDMPRDGRVVLDADESRHLTRVRRLGPGDAVELFDGYGFARAANVVAIARGSVELELIGPGLPERAVPYQLTLATAVPKGDRFDWLVEKATELGVGTLVPLLTERSVVDPRATKLDRLRRRSIEACKQCGRSRLLEIAAPVRLCELLAQGLGTIRVLAHPSGVPPARWPRGTSGKAATLAIGPEGGFTESEVRLAEEFGWTLGRLGPLLLRVETAGLAGSALLLGLSGDTAE